MFTERKLLACLVWLELIKVCTRGNNNHSLGVVIIVKAVLFFNLVMSTGNNQVCVGEQIFLCVDAALNIVGTGYLFTTNAASQQALSLVSSQGVPGMYQRSAKQV